LRNVQKIIVTKQAQCIYEFGLFRVEAAKRVLLRGGEVVPLTPKCFDLLLALVETSAEVIGKDDLMNRVWPDSFVEEGNLTYNISMLRKALGEKASEHQYIVTIPGRGYQFSAAVRELSNEATARSAERVKELASESEAQTEDVRTAAPRIHPLKRHAVILAGFALLVLAIAAIYFLTARKSGQPQSGLAIESLAVLPFKPLVAERRDETLELGMADTLINKLSSIKERSSCGQSAPCANTAHSIKTRLRRGASWGWMPCLTPAFSGIARIRYELRHGC